MIMLFGRVAPPSPETKSIPVQGHKYGSTQVQSHLCKINTKPHGNKKESKSLVKDDCKESVQLANTLHIQELRYLVNSFKK
jgi:hypothetical protein